MHYIKKLIGIVLLCTAGIVYGQTPNAVAGYNFLAGPCSSTATQPSFRAICAQDIPVFIASGVGHQPGGVPDPGNTAGTTHFLREDATWQLVDPNGAGGSTGMNTYTIAASNTPLANGANPNLILTGTGDMTAISNAINSWCGNSQTGVPGCLINLMPGIYNPSGSDTNPVVIDNDDVEIRGTGNCMWGGYDQPFGGTSTPAGAVGLGCAQLNAGTGANVIEIRHNNAGGTGVSADQLRHRGIKIDNLYLVGKSYTGYGIYDAGAHPDDNVFIQNNIIQKTSQGIYVNLDSGDISYNSVQDNLGSAISNTLLSGCCYLRIHNNLIYDGGSTGDSASLSYGIVNYSVGAVISDNIVGDYYGGIYTNGYHTVIASNSLNGIAGKFINVAFARGVSVTGNNFNNYDTNAGYIAKYYYVGNVPAISCQSGSNNFGVTVTGNTFDTIFPTTGAAIDFTNCPSSIGTGNTFMGEWGYNAPTVSGTNSTFANNNNTFVPMSVPAAVTSAILVQRLTAASVSQSNNTTITSLVDQSGWANNGAGSGTPTYITSSTINSHPGIRFSAVGSYFTCGGCYTPQTNLGRTWFGVINYTTAPTGSNTATLLNAGGGIPAIYVNSSNQVCVFAGSAACDTTNTLTVGSNYIIEVATTAAGTSSRVSINGALATINPGVPSTTTGNYAQLRLGGNGASSNVQMDVGESDFYYLTMTSADAATVASALSTAYGITITSGSANW